jgi:hypothetical protein
MPDKPWTPTIDRVGFAACCDGLVGFDAKGQRWEVVNTRALSYQPTGRRHQCEGADRKTRSAPDGESRHATPDRP